MAHYQHQTTEQNHPRVVEAFEALFDMLQATGMTPVQVIECAEAGMSAWLARDTLGAHAAVTVLVAGEIATDLLTLTEEEYRAHVRTA